MLDGTTPDTIGQTARDAEAFIDALSLETADLLAHSMGGLVAQEVALDRPGLVHRLVLVGTAPAAARASAKCRRRRAIQGLGVGPGCSNHVRGLPR